MVFGKECTNQPNDPIKLTIIDMQVTRKYGLLDFSIIMRSALLIFGKYYYINLYLICFKLEKWKITRNSFLVRISYLLYVFDQSFLKSENCKITKIQNTALILAQEKCKLNYFLICPMIRF